MSVAGDHIGIPEIWDVGPDEDAQADAGVPGKGCSSPLGDFQGTAALCPLQWARSTPLPPAAIICIRQHHRLEEQQLISSHLAKKADP